MLTCGKNERTPQALDGSRRLTGNFQRRAARRKARGEAAEAGMKAADSTFRNNDARANAYNNAAIQSGITAGKEEGIAKAAAEIGHMDSNLDLHVRAKVADMDLESVKAEQAATFKEISTEAGAAAHPEIANDLKLQARAAHEATEVQTRRANSAGRVANEEVAELIRDSSSGAAQMAAGIGGMPALTRVQAEATQVEHKAFDEAVSAEKTTMTSLSHDQLLAEMQDTTLSVERRAAAAGAIMSRDYREGHMQALEIAGKLGVEGDPVISDIQKQMAYDMKDKPFALGDQAAGQLQIGTYGKPQPPRPDGSIPPQLGNIRTELRDRVASKLSVANLAKMNPDEMKRIHKDAVAGNLRPEQLANLKKVIEDTRVDDQFKGLVKPEAKTLHDDILALP